MSISVFSPTDLSDQAPRAKITLGDLMQTHQFCAWATRYQEDRGTTKVPFRDYARGVEIEARSNEPYKWLSLDRAAWVAQQLEQNYPDLPAGIGVFFGEYDCCLCGYRLGGLDGDTCIGEDGVIAPWMVDAIERLNSYTEVSPSGTGLKIYFLYRTDDLERIRLMMGTQTGKQYKKSSEGDHPPGFEFYIARRFFALTGDRHGSVEAINEIRLEDFEWLVRELGPRVAEKSAPTTRLVKTADGRKVTQIVGGHDNSRSARARNRAWRLQRDDGLQHPHEIKEALLNDPDEGVRDWMVEKGLVNGEREFMRVIEKTKPIPGTHDETRCDYARNCYEQRLYGDDFDSILGRT